MMGFIERAFMLCILAFQAASVKTYTSDKAGCLMPEAAWWRRPRRPLASSINPLGNERKNLNPSLPETSSSIYRQFAALLDLGISTAVVDKDHMGACVDLFHA